MNIFLKARPVCIISQLLTIKTLENVLKQKNNYVKLIINNVLSLGLVFACIAFEKAFGLHSCLPTDQRNSATVFLD